MKLKIENLGVKFGKEVCVFENLNLNIKENEFVSIIGSSGCGKTTLLNCIAGFNGNYTGEIVIDNKMIQGISSRVGVVFQDHNLFPWKTVKQNIAFGLEIKKISKKTIDKKVSEFIELFGLQGFEDFYPHQISGGMKQRVGIARALIIDPDVLLMDEPFGALDKLTRVKMQDFLLKIWKKTKKTIIFVTHDIDEGIFLSDRVIVLSKRPSQILGEIKIDLPRPRNQETMLTKKFLEIKKQIFEKGFGKNGIN